MVLIVLLSSYTRGREVTKHCSVLTLPCVRMVAYKIALCSHVPTVFPYLFPVLYLLGIFPHHRHSPQRKFVGFYLFLGSLRQVHIPLFSTIFLLRSLVPQRLTCSFVPQDSFIFPCSLRYFCFVLLFPKSTGRPTVVFSSSHGVNRLIKQKKKR